MIERARRFLIYTVQEFCYRLGRLQKFLFHRHDMDLMQRVPCRDGRIPDRLLQTCPRSLRVNNRYLPGEKIEFCVNGDECKLTVLYRTQRVLKNMTCQGTSGIEVTVTDDDGIETKQRCLFPAHPMQMWVTDTFKIKGKGKLSSSLPPFALVDSILVSPKVFGKEIVRETPDIVAYGSSVTHGCAASRPSLAYPCILERLTGRRVLNFGFSESARGEPDVVRYVASLGAGIMIVEYDHNVSVEELRRTHLAVYQTIRSVSDCWILFMSRFTGGLSITEEEEKERIRIITDTCREAENLRDHKVALLPGNTVFGTDKENYFPDGVHPNDAGMEMIARAIYDRIRERGMLN